MNPTEIKECPFCGSRRILSYQKINIWFVSCEDCHCDGPLTHDDIHSEESAIKEWNRRSTVSLKTAQDMADALCLAELNMKDARANGIGQGGAIERAQNALSAFEQEKKGGGV